LFFPSGLTFENLSLLPEFKEKARKQENIEKQELAGIILRILKRIEYI